MSYSQEKYIQRLNNFYWDRDANKSFIERNDAFFKKLDSFEVDILSRYSLHYAQCLRDTNQLENHLAALFKEVMRFISDNASPFFAPFLLFFNDTSAQINLIDSYFFSVLCTFMHTTTRIKRKSYSDFIYERHPSKYNDPASPSHLSKAQIEFETDKFRKSRNRKLKKGRVYIPEHKWAAVPKTLEHELAFHFIIEQKNSDLTDTYKRLGNLYNDILRVVDAEKNSQFEDNLRDAVKKFHSKLKKLDYSKFLELQKTIFEHICSDEEYIGINLYRLERTMAPFRIMHDVNMLASYPFDNHMEADYLTRTAYLKDIPFPRIYHALLFSQADIPTIADHADTFDVLLHHINFIGCLILDALIEENFFGDNWENLLRNLSNKLVQKVLYNPHGFSIPKLNEKSQAKFENLLAAPIALLEMDELALYRASKNVSTDSSC